MAQEQKTKQRRIFIAMDGSKHSTYALEWFVENLHRKGDEVWLAHCAEQFHLQPTDLLGANETSAEELYKSNIDKSKAIARQLQELGRKYNLECNVQQLHGYPGHSLVKAAEEKNAGMIVCGSRGQGLFRRTMLGSISDYLLHHARMPVIICKHEQEQEKLKQSH